jgi:sorting nexin-29
LKHGDALPPLLFNLALEYAIRRVQVNQGGVKFNGTHQLLVYAGDVNILGQSIRTKVKNTEALLVTGKETGLEVNADKTVYMVMPRYQNTGRNHNIKVDKRSLEMVEEFRYLGTTLINQNSDQEEIKTRLKSGNACYHLVQNLSSSCLHSKNTKIKVYRSVILRVVFYGCDTWSLTLREEHRLGVFEKRVLRRVFGP